MDRELAIVPGIEPDLLARIVDRVLALEPGAIAILVSGSYAQGAADEQSDLDLVVVREGEPSTPYRMWFEERPGHSPLHVSPSWRSVERCLAERSEPEAWALGFPVHDVTSYVWATDDVRATFGDPPDYVHPPPSPELEDFVEFLGKVRRCASLGDRVGVRAFAREAAALAPGLLRALNPEVVVRNRREAVEAARGLPVAPDHYREDFEVAFGISAADDAAVERSALRLGRDLLAFLRERRPDADPQPDIARYLANGTFERHLGFVDPI
jgi:nucleotidyltransferase-like protein